nr:homeobox-like protein HDP1 [Cherax quadricarinatus]
MEDKGPPLESLSPGGVSKVLNKQTFKCHLSAWERAKSIQGPFQKPDMKLTSKSVITQHTESDTQTKSSSIFQQASKHEGLKVVSQIHQHSEVSTKCFKSLEGTDGSIPSCSFQKASKLFSCHHAPPSGLEESFIFEQESEQENPQKMPPIQEQSDSSISKVGEQNACPNIQEKYSAPRAPVFKKVTKVSVLKIPAVQDNMTRKSLTSSSEHELVSTTKSSGLAQPAFNHSSSSAFTHVFTQKNRPTFSKPVFVARPTNSNSKSQSKSNAITDKIPAGNDPTSKDKIIPLRPTFCKKQASASKPLLETQPNKRERSPTLINTGTSEAVKNLVSSSSDINITKMKYINKTILEEPFPGVMKKDFSDNSVQKTKKIDNQHCSNSKEHIRFAKQTNTSEVKNAEKRLGNKERSTVKRSLKGVVWARVQGALWWPAMVDIDPDYKKYMWLNDIATSPISYHVTFFGEPVTRAWVTPMNMKPFEKSDTYERFLMCESKEKISITHLREAVDSAHQALDMDLQCRRKTFAFVVRFNGKLKAKHSRSSNDCSQKLNKAKRKKVSLTNNKQSETWPPSPHGHNLPDIIPTGEYEFNRIKSSTPVEKPAFKRKLWNASDLFSEKSVSPVQESENCPTVSKRFAIIQRGKCDKRETKQRGHVSCSKQGEFSWQSDRDQSGENVDEKGKQSGDSADKKGIYEEPKKKKKFECDKYLEDDIGKKIKAKNHCTKCSANSNTKQDKFEKQDKEEEVEEENGGLFKKQVEYEEQGDDYEDENEEKCDNVNKKQSKKKCIFKKCNTDGDSEEPNNKDGEYMEQEDTNSNYEHPSGKDGKNREFCNKDGTDGNNELNNECDVQVQDDTIVDDELYNKDANYEEVYNGGDDEEHSNKGSDYEEVYNGGDEECCSKDAEYEESCNGDKEPYNKDADFEIYNGDEEHCIKNVDYKGYSGGGDEEPCNKDVEYEDYNSGGEEHCNKNADYEEGYNDGEEEHCNKNADYEEGYNDGEEEHCNKNADYEEGYNDGEEEHCNKNADYEEGYNDGEEEHCNKNADYEEGYNDGEEEHCNKNADYEEGYNDGEEEHCNKNADHEQDYNGGGGDESCNKDADYEGYNGNEDEHCSKDADYEGYNGDGCDEPCNKDAGNETDTFVDDKHKEPDNHKGEYKEKDNIAEYERSSDGEYEPWEDDDCGNQNNDGEFDNDDGNKECDKNNNSECEDQDNSDDECENQDINSEYEDEKGDCEEPKKNDGNLGSENDELNNNEHQDNDDYEEQDYDEGDNAEDGENDDFDNQNNGYEQGESYEDNDKQYDSGDSEEQGSEARKEHSKDSEDEGDSKDACENQEINHVEYKDDDKGDYEESKENDENRGSENVEQYNNSEYKDNGEYHEEQDFDDEKDNAENEEHDFEKQNK